ncbi:pyridoxamine 5'-phosphate oxidase family protein [Parasphingorhabdus pacifica]
MTTAPLSPTPRSSPRRHNDRAADDPAELRSILDEALICHLGLQVDGAPRVMPTGYGRIGDQLYIHASSGARGLREAAERVEVCVTVTLLDGIVYSRAAANHSMNYRSAMLHGPARAVTEPDEKWQALRALTEHLAPGSWDHTRKPSKRELAKTAVIAVALDEAAVKTRIGGPGDEDADVADSDTWAGVLPLRWNWGEPEPCVQLAADAEIPRHVRDRVGG